MCYFGARVLLESGELNAARWLLFVRGQHSGTDTQPRWATGTSTWQWLIWRGRYRGCGRWWHQTGGSVTRQFQLQMEICMSRLHLNTLTSLHINHTHTNYRQLPTPLCLYQTVYRQLYECWQFSKKYVLITTTKYKVNKKITSLLWKKWVKFQE